MSSHSSTMTKTLVVSLVLELATLIAETIGGLMTHSLALLSDAGHVLSDLLSLVVTLFALRLAMRPATTQRSFGYHRAEIIGAMVNGLLLVGVAVFIGYEAFDRLAHPVEIHAGYASIIAAIGLLPNAWTVWRLRRSQNLNIRSAFYHALGDAASSILVVVSSVAIALTGNHALDVVASFAIIVLLVVSAARLLRQSLAILLEGAPPNIDPARISQAVCSVPGIKGSHDEHLWTLCSDVVYLTGHVVLEEHRSVREADAIIAAATKKLDALGVHHVTLQPETSETSCEKNGACEIMH